MTNKPLPVADADVNIQLPSDEIWEENKGKIFAAIAIVIAVAIGFIVWFYWKQEKQTTAARDFALATTPEELKSVVETHSGTPVAVNAAILLGALQRNAGDFQAAAQTFQTVLESKQDHALRPTAALAEAELTVQSAGKTNPDTAATALLAVAEGYPDAYTAPYATFQLGELYERTGQIQLALQTFRSLLGNYPNSLLVRIASMKVQELSLANSSPGTEVSAGSNETAPSEAP